MKLSGFTFVRNAVRLDYPVVESISSILPIVDEFIVNVGPDEDGTLDLIRSIEDPKIKIIQSQWNPNVITGGYVFAQQVNIALFNCMGKWAFHLQPDEVIHEEDLPIIMKYVDKYLDDDLVEGLALRTLNFWRDYNTILNVYPWRGMRRIRIIKPHRFVLSRGDSAGFTVHPKYKEKGRRIRVLDTNARLFHYSTVKSEKALKAKSEAVVNYYRSENPSKAYYNKNLYQYLPRQFVVLYEGTHPKVMLERIKKHPVSLDLSSPQWATKMTWGNRWRILKTILTEHLTDRFSGKGSYRLLREK